MPGLDLSVALLRGFAIALIAAAVIPFLFKTVRRQALWAAGLPAAIAYYGWAFPGFLVVSGLGFTVAWALSRIQDRDSRWRWAALALVVLIALFTAGRIGRWDQLAVLVVGGRSLSACTLDMWLVLRVVTLFWEVGSGAVKAPTAGACLGWAALPMTLGGPLLRYSELPVVIETRPAVWLVPGWWRELMRAAAKLAAGVVLGFVPAFMADHWPASRLLRGAVVVFITGPVGFYLTFAGYYHLMQTLARPVGIAIPDSFNWPFGRENISAFWANWNITATRVFREYLFYNRWGLRGYNVYVNTLVLFGLVGLWHGADAYWVSWGLLHGITFCGFLAWRRSQTGRGLQQGPAPGTRADIAGRVATYVCVCAAWYLPSKVLSLVGGVT
jgi:D-alanyl-lipoteichoic acid acyltransferase DltB (MBOAT superfamily)